jgi:hypothetical protein
MDFKTPEQYFFRYAFPCSHIKLKRKEITLEKYHELEKRFLENNPPEKKELEKIYSNGFFFIKRLAKKRNKEYWDIEILEEYWKTEHNNIIDKAEKNYKDSPEPMKDLCRTINAEIIEKKPGIIIVKYDNKKRNVKNPFFPELNIGDTVKIHYSYAVDKF